MWCGAFEVPITVFMDTVTQYFCPWKAQKDLVMPDQLGDFLFGFLFCWCFGFGFCLGVFFFYFVGFWF